MDKLGDSLENLFTYCGRHFSVPCVCNIAIQILDCIEELHSNNYLHRDIKPDNFLVEAGDKHKAKKIYMIDLGLGKVWKENGKHIQEKLGKRLIGTPRYASIHTHFGREQSRRDDLESLGYMLMYFVRSSLPWQGLKGATKEDKYQKIGTKKRDTSVEELCRGSPKAFAKYLNMCLALKFDERPNYDKMKKLFQHTLREYGGQKNSFDWHDKVCLYLSLFVSVSLIFVLLFLFCLNSIQSIICFACLCKKKDKYQTTICVDPRNLQWFLRNCVVFFA